MARILVGSVGGRFGPVALIRFTWETWNRRALRQPGALLDPAKPRWSTEDSKWHRSVTLGVFDVDRNEDECLDPVLPDDEELFL